MWTTIKTDIMVHMTDLNLFGCMSGIEASIRYNQFIHAQWILEISTENSLEKFLQRYINESGILPNYFILAYAQRPNNTNYISINNVCSRSPKIKV